MLEKRWNDDSCLISKVIFNIVGHPPSLPFPYQAKYLCKTTRKLSKPCNISLRLFFFKKKIRVKIHFIS